MSRLSTVLLLLSIVNYVIAYNREAAEEELRSISENAQTYITEVIICVAVVSVLIFATVLCICDMAIRMLFDHCGQESDKKKAVDVETGSTSSLRFSTASEEGYYVNENYAMISPSVISVSIMDSSVDDITLADLPHVVVLRIIQCDNYNSVDDLKMISQTWNTLVLEFLAKRKVRVAPAIKRLDISELYGIWDYYIIDEDPSFTPCLKTWMRILPVFFAEGFAVLTSLRSQRVSVLWWMFTLGGLWAVELFSRLKAENKQDLRVAALRSSHVDKLHLDCVSEATIADLRRVLRGVQVTELEVKLERCDQKMQCKLAEMICNNDVIDFKLSIAVGTPSTYAFQTLAKSLTRANREKAEKDIEKKDVEEREDSDS